MRLNFGMKLKKIHQKLAGQELKTLVYWVLQICWDTTKKATFSRLN